MGEIADMPTWRERAEYAEGELLKAGVTVLLTREASERVRAERDAAVKRASELEEALLPFAEACACLDNPNPDHMEIWEHPAAMCITAGDLRKARSALQPTPEEK